MNDRYIDFYNNSFSTRKLKIKSMLRLFPVTPFAFAISMSLIFTSPKTRHIDDTCREIQMTFQRISIFVPMLILPSLFFVFSFILNLGLFKVSRRLHLYYPNFPISLRIYAIQLRSLMLIRQLY